MTDEESRRLTGAKSEPETVVNPAGSNVRRQESHDFSQNFGVVPDRPSARPDAFSDREGPTLASPSTSALSTDVGLERRLMQAIDRIHQLEVDLEALFSRVSKLSEAFDAERLRGRAARMGRYLLWGAVIAAMATFWMLLRLRSGLR